MLQKVFNVVLMFVYACVVVFICVLFVPSHISLQQVQPVDPQDITGTVSGPAIPQVQPVDPQMLQVQPVGPQIPQMQPVDPKIPQVQPVDP